MGLLSFLQTLTLALSLAHSSRLFASAQSINLSVFSTPSCSGVQAVYLDIPPGVCLVSFDDPSWGRSINVWGTLVDEGGAWGSVTGWKNENCTVEQYQYRPDSNSGACLANIQEEKRAISYSWTAAETSADTKKTETECIGPDFLEYVDKDLGVSRQISVKGLKHDDLRKLVNHLA